MKCKGNARAEANCDDNGISMACMIFQFYWVQVAREDISPYIHVQITKYKPLVHVRGGYYLQFFYIHFML